MSCSIFVSSTVWCIIMLVHFHGSDALKCWTCNSNGTNSKFCEDPFDSSVISEHQRYRSYSECKSPAGQLNPYSHASMQKAVCMKLVQIVNGKTEYLRKCEFADINEPKNACVYGKTPPNVENDFCETCHTDGCNSGSQYQPIAGLITLSVIKLFALL